MKERTTALLNLITYNARWENLLTALQSFPWDSDAVLAIITRAHLRDILQRFIKGELNSEQIEEWANAIECREDIDYEASHAEMIKEVMHQLANPLLTEPFNQALAMRWLEVMSVTHQPEG